MIKRILRNISKYGYIDTYHLAINYIYNYSRLRIIQEAIVLTKAKTYLEIGVREGAVFKNIKSDLLTSKIAVDPQRHEQMSELKINEYFFHKTSDEFFENDAQTLFVDKDLLIDVVFIDGLHVFEQVVKDFQNVEKYMSDKGIIILHDCNPLSEADENLNNRGSDGRWNGDVWKCAYYIVRNRKDLKLITLNCDNGLGIIYGFNRSNKKELDSKEVDRIKKLDFYFFNTNKTELVNLVSPFKWNKIKQNIISLKA